MNVRNPLVVFVFPIMAMRIKKKRAEKKEIFYFDFINIYRKC